MEFTNRAEFGCICGTAMGFYVVTAFFTVYSKNFRLLGIILLIGFTSVVVSLFISVLTWYRERDLRLLRQTRRPNLTQVQINRLKVFNYSLRSFQGGSATQAIDSTQSVCCICISDYEAGEELIELSCGHCYHKTCISNWLLKRAKCPTCKAAVVAPQTPTEAALSANSQSPLGSRGIVFASYGGTHAVMYPDVTLATHV